MSSNKNFYITTTLPYVNADPHIGFAMEIIQADVITRFKRQKGFEVFFNFGVDEHGIKILRKAQEAGMEPKAYCDIYAAKFNNLKAALNLSYNNFIRTTDEYHVAAAQEFWLRCQKNGDIYKKNYKVKYCVGCELEKTDSELEDSKCPVHPNLEIELIEEENYFFRYSKYQQSLLDFYEKNPEFVVPATKFNEIKEFTKQGLEDFSISRLKEKMPWGVAVPDDDKHVMYVWFDALVSYISALGWPEDEKKFAEFWPGMQVAGKDNLRQQSSMWQAMLMSAGLPNSRQIFIHGFISVDGQKMSKSLGNAVDPFELVKQYGTDAVRHFLIQHIHPFEDGDFTIERFEERYNSDLADGLGNLVARIVKLAQLYLDEDVVQESWQKDKKYEKDYEEPLKNFRCDQASDYIFREISRIDKDISEEKSFEVVRKDRKTGEKLIKKYVQELYRIADLLEPFMPGTSEKIKQAVESKKSEMLFPRLAKALT